jgi:hypothetical protein
MPARTAILDFVELVPTNALAVTDQFAGEMPTYQYQSGLSGDARAKDSILRDQVFALEK